MQVYSDAFRSSSCPLHFFFFNPDNGNCTIEVTLKSLNIPRRLGFTQIRNSRILIKTKL